MKKTPAQINEPASRGLTKNNINNHTLKLSKKPLNRFECYKNLLDEFLIDNPAHTQEELYSACQYFADQCGLTVAPKAKGGLNV